MARLLLIETLKRDRYHHLRAEFFPLILGLARERAWPARWWTLVISPEQMHRDARFAAGLTPEQKAQLAAELRAWGPEVIVVHDRPGADLLEVLGESAPDARVVDLTRVQIARAGAPGEPPRTERLSPRVSVAELEAVLGGEPGPSGGTQAREGPVAADALPFVYERRVIGPAEASALRLPTRLLLEHVCPFRRPVRANPLYAELPAPVVRTHLGCTFCAKATGPPPTERAETAIDRALRQVAAHQASEPERRGPREYFFEDATFNGRLADLLEAAMERELAPAIFTTMLRADVLLAQRGRLAEVLPRASGAGHGIQLISIGAESFSAAENERFNKGVTPEQLWDCFAMIRELEERFPGSFGCVDPGYYATILFTPWTRPEDLLANIAAARKLGIEYLKKAMGTRLQLLDDLPITELARHDGLVLEGEAAASEIPDANLWNVDFRDHHWRFADPRTALAQRVLVRLDPIPEQVRLAPDDALLAEIRAARRALPPALGWDYVALAEALVHAVIALGPDAEIGALFARAAKVAEPGEAPEGGWPSAPWSSEAPEDDVDAEPEAGTPEPSLDGSWVGELLARIVARQPAWLAGYAVSRAALEREDDRAHLRLELEGPRGELRLCIDDRESGPGGWLAAERFSARHLGQLPADRRSEEHLVRALLAVFDRLAPEGGVAALDESRAG